MALQFKAGVSLKDLQPQMLIALQVVEEIFSHFSLDTVVTSANDGQHMNNSYHYRGRAFDFRTKHAAGLMNGLVAEMTKRLGPLGFDVIWEGIGTENEHLHVELDRRAGY
jgi:hypothetical protein